MDKFMKEEARERGKYIVGKMKNTLRDNGKKAIRLVGDGVYIGIGIAALTFEKYGKRKVKDQKFIEI